MKVERDADKARFMSRVSITPSGCWEWKGYRCKDGYGRSIKLSFGKFGLAHRASYSLFVGPIGDGLTIDHLCRNRACANPAHLEAVSLKENTLRGNTIVAAFAKRTHCANGHPFSGRNVRFYKTRRLCMECQRQATARYLARKKSA